MKKILLLMLAGIGDSLLFTPTIRALRKEYPEATITALVRDKPVQAILQRNKDLNVILYYPFMKSGNLRSVLYCFKLRHEKYDLSVLAYPANRYQHNVISFLIGAKKRIAHIYEIKQFTSLSFLHTDRIPINYSHHNIDENLFLLTFLGIDKKKCSRKINFSLTQQEKAFAQKYLDEDHINKKDLLIGIHPGSSELAGMANKRWPKERFAEFADMLIEKKKAKILLFGDDSELPLREEIQKQMRNKVCIVRTPTVFETAALIERCKSFISNDTGLMHIASYYEIPSVIILGHLNPHKTRPQHKKVKVLSPVTNCQSYRIGENLVCKYAETEKYCLNQISVEQAYHAFEEVMR